MLHNPAAFALAGNATFTLVSNKTSARFTYRVRVAPDGDNLHFVQVLTGPNNAEDFEYLGFIRAGAYVHGRKSRIALTAPSAQAFAWFWAHRDAPPASLTIHHEGKCGRCGRALTVPESIESGFGPECITKVSL